MSQPHQRRKFSEKSRQEFYKALRRIHSRGRKTISANILADEMWPTARRINANGQVFNLAAGIAGRMLNQIRGCQEIEYRIWEIIPEFIANDGK